MPRRLAFQDQYDVPKLRKAIDNNEPSLITWENHTLNSQNFDEPGACPPDWISVFEIYEEIEEWSYSWL
ncbi:MAG: hypothetical protein HEP71_15805 [Roseivirga sp.]|nr:hypothetical protein [Roseivirga sp.]